MHDGTIPALQELGVSEANLSSGSIQCVWCLPCLFIPAGHSTSLKEPGLTRDVGFKCTKCRNSIPGGFQERSEVKRPERASERGNNPKGLGKRIRSRAHCKGTSKIKATSKQMVGSGTEIMFPTGEGSYSRHLGPDTELRQRNRYCALGTLRRGAPPAQDGENGQRRMLLLTCSVSDSCY